MSNDTPQPVATFARAVVQAGRELRGFEATETVEAGPIRVVARIRFHRSETLTVEYQSYVSPLLEVEETLTGDADYTADELVGLSLHYDGQRTWCHDASTGVCIVKPSRSMFEPIPEMATLGDLHCLRDLPHDYLLRDLGNEQIDGRAARVLSLKPKRVHRAHAFKLIAYLSEKAVVAFDEQTLFPVRLCFSPAPSTQAHHLLGPDGQITVRYEAVRLLADAPPPFAPPEGTRVFREGQIEIGDLVERLSFPFAIDRLREAGFEAFGGRALLAEDPDHDRAYFVATFLRSEDGADEPSQILTVRAGNYLSRVMARRRLAASESGEEMQLADRSARFFDRRGLWEEQASGLDADHAPRELSWDRDGVFWFLTGVNVERSTLTKLASDLIESDSKGA